MSALMGAEDYRGERRREEPFETTD